MGLEVNIRFLTKYSCLDSTLIYGAHDIRGTVTRWGAEHDTAFRLYVKEQLVTMSVVTLMPQLAT